MEQTVSVASSCRNLPVSLKKEKVAGSFESAFIALACIRMVRSLAWLASYWLALGKYILIVHYFTYSSVARGMDKQASQPSNDKTG